MATDVSVEDRQSLPQAVRWKIADLMAEDNLAKINEKEKRVEEKKTFYSLYGKRFIDIVVSLFAIIITFPINVIIGLITFFDVGRPVFFVQNRVGKNGKTFKIIKFRNMRNAFDENGELLPAKQRVTKWGHFARKTSLDELLNFISVLKGDMSIIGPRPLVPQYMSRYSERHLSRYNVKPGLECPPRNINIPIRNWNDQFENDVWYVENLSLKTDLSMMVNLLRFALDRSNTELRGAAKRGDFIGYSSEGIAVDLSEVPEIYIQRAMAENEHQIHAGL